MQPEEKYRSPIVFKYGGNAMTNPDLQQSVLSRIADLWKANVPVVITHGGGPFIKAALERGGIRSEFVGGHRVTTPEAYVHVESALRGEVNGSLVRRLNALGVKAVGLSGIDAGMVLARKRMYQEPQGDGSFVEKDLGRVGDVASVDTTLLHQLMEQGYLPILSCVAADKAGTGYNINADMFAGHIAGALKARQYIVLTDVDGLFRDKDDPGTLISKLKANEIDALEAEGVVVGGMIPKVRSCRIALEKGASQARIVNGTKPQLLSHPDALETVGTLIEQ